MHLRHYLTGIFDNSLGSTSATADAQGNKVSELRYDPLGRSALSRSIPKRSEAGAWGAQVTDYRVAPLERSGRGTYTGQYSYTDAFGLMYYREASLWG